jgi:hypothetical protein
MLVRCGSFMEASAARIRPTATRRTRQKACPTGAGPQTSRSRPLPLAHGKEGVIGSSPMLGLLESGRKICGFAVLNSVRTPATASRNAYGPACCPMLPFKPRPRGESDSRKKGRVRLPVTECREREARVKHAAGYGSITPTVAIDSILIELGDGYG